MRKKHAVLKGDTTTAPAAALKEAAATGDGVIDNHAPPLPAEVRLLAYQKWEAAGRPLGQDFRFWMEAEQELLHGQRH